MMSYMGIAVISLGIQLHTFTSVWVVHVSQFPIEFVQGFENIDRYSPPMYLVSDLIRYDTKTT